MESQTTAAAIDDFEEELIQMNTAGSTQEELLTWLDKHGVIVSRRTLVRRLKQWQEESSSSDSEQLINLIDHLFSHSTYLF
jgi:arginine repressor